MEASCITIHFGQTVRELLARVTHQESVSRHWSCISVPATLSLVGAARESIDSKETSVWISEQSSWDLCQLHSLSLEVCQALLNQVSPLFPRNIPFTSYCSELGHKIFPPWKIVEVNWLFGTESTMLIIITKKKIKVPLAKNTRPMFLVTATHLPSLLDELMKISEPGLQSSTTTLRLFLGIMCPFTTSHLSVCMFPPKKEVQEPNKTKQKETSISFPSQNTK